MPNTSAAALSKAYSPLNLEARSLPWQIAAVALGTIVLALSSHLAIPMVPVPVTMQTFAVAMIGALYGWRLGAITVLAWLGEAALGMPVLANGTGGLAPFVGPTAGYLYSFPLMAALAGWLAARGWNGDRPILAFVNFLLANALGLALGWAWLARIIGPEQALAAGVLPFIIGALLKSGLGAALLYALDFGRTRKAE
jgi:biotin transport system substrate-specific component